MILQRKHHYILGIESEVLNILTKVSVTLIPY